MGGTASIFGQLRLPESDVARQAYTYVADSTAGYVVNHCLRSYVFARAHAENHCLRAGSDYDDEVVFLSCVLHDIGLSEQGNGEQRFEVDGADTAVAFLRTCAVDESCLQIVWDAIALHTSPGIADRKGPEVALTFAGIATDILGAKRDALPPGLADEVHALLPRNNLGYALSADILGQAMAKPHKAIPMTFAGELLRRQLPAGALPDWYDLIASAGWGDAPLTI